MAIASRNTQESIFGVVQGFTLGTMILAGALLAVPLHKVTIGHGGSLAQVISQTTQFPALGAALWLLEIVLYFALAWHASRHPLLGFAGVLVGVVNRLVISTLVALLVGALAQTSFNAVFLENEAGRWAYRMLAIVAAGLIIAIPFRRLLATGFGLLEEADPPPTAKKTASGTCSKKAPERPKQFHFAAPARPTTADAAANRAATPYTVRRMGTAGGAAVNELQPPEGFTAVPALDNVFGFVNVPREIILRAIPEAEPFLEANKPVRVRLGLVVPQLRRGVLWITWQQLMGMETPGAAARPDSNLRDRWIRIPDKHYAMQVPPEYFQTVKSPPAWMQLAEVPQEAQFSLKD